MANNFTNDANCVALWRFESGALTTDSKGSNTLTDNNTVATEITKYKEGSASAGFTESSAEYFSIADADLDAGFPLKNGDATKKISICGWFYPNSFPGGLGGIVSKYDDNDKRSLYIRCYNAFQVRIGTGTGDDSEVLYDDETPTTGRWYHFGFTYDNADKSWRFVVWDDTAGSKVVDTSGTSTGNINAEDATFGIGIDYFSTGTPQNTFDGYIDEVVVFKDILSANEIDQIRAGTYNIEISIDGADTYHTHSAGSPVLTQQHNLTVQGADHLHTASSPKLIRNMLKNLNAYHVQTAESPVLTQVHNLTVNDAYHTHAVESPALTQKHTLTMQDAYHVHAADNVGSFFVLSVNDAAHVHVASSPVINFVVSANDAYHNHVADGDLALTQKHILAMQNAYHVLASPQVQIQWVGWLEAYGAKATKYYYCTLTGENESPAVADVTLPMSSFQARRKSGDPTFLSVVIPGTAYQSYIEDRTNGEVVISCTYEYNGVSNTAEIFRADYEYFTLHEGGNNQSIIITAHKTETFTAQNKTLLDATYMRVDDGKIAFRCATIDPFLQPGDTCTYTIYTFVANQIAMSVSTKGVTMEVQEDTS